MNINPKVALAVALLLGLAAPAEAAMVRVHSEGDRLKVRIRSDRPRLLGSVPEPGGARWDFQVSRSANRTERRALASGPIREIATVQRGRKLSVTVRWRFPLPDLRPSTTRSGIELRFRKRPYRWSTVPLKDGVTYQRLSLLSAGGPVNVHLLRLRLSEVDLKLRMASSRDIFGRDTVPGIVRNYGAFAGINGSFFAPATGAPVGLLFSEGDILSSSFVNRSVFGIRKDGTCFISQSRLFAAIAEEGGKVYLAKAVNKRPVRGKIVLYTPHWGTRTRSIPDPSRREFSIDRDGKILAIATGNMAIPRGGYVLSAQGKPIFELRKRFRVGMPLRVFSRLNGVFEGARYAIGGGPTLVRDGKVRVTAREEGFGPEIAHGRAARTAIGYFGGEHVALVTVDGHPRGESAKRRAFRMAANTVDSVGMTLLELARLLRSIGVKDAINLDGGGSSTMVVDGRTVNHPVDGAARPVHNALLVY